ncbi:hypothetical protein NQZ68_007152 [Dissostichus eleginoides]|nr:hypothetical protein NQZ68_007152 [Dissostichus eleginoides]
MVAFNICPGVLHGCNEAHGEVHRKEELQSSRAPELQSSRRGGRWTAGFLPFSLGFIFVAVLLQSATVLSQSRRVSVRSGRTLLLLSAAAAREFLESQSECSRITADLSLR